MEAIPTLGTEADIKNAITHGKRFKIASSVKRIELWTEQILNHYCVADALQENNSITAVKLNHSWQTLPTKSAPILESLHASKVLQELEVESNNERFFSSVGNLLMENSSLKSLSIIGFGCMNSDQFYKGLEDNSSLATLDVRTSSLATLDVRTFDNYNQREKIHDDFKRIVAALRKNPTVLRFEIRQNNPKSKSLGSVVSPHAVVTDDLVHLSFLIERRSTDQLDELISNCNWEQLAQFLRSNCQTVLVKKFYSEGHNLSTKTFVDKLAIHALQKMVEDATNEKNKIQSETEEKRKQFSALTKKRDELRKQLDGVEADLIKVDSQIQSNSTLLSEKSAAQLFLRENMQGFENALKKNEPALKKWQQKLQTDIGTWSCEDVSFLLTEIGLGKYSQVFVANKIDGTVLKALETNDLISTLEVSFKEAKKLLMYVHLVQTQHDIYAIPPGVLQWNNDTVCTWLKDNKFGHLVEIFVNHQICGAEFVFLEKTELTRHLKIQALGDVIKLHLEIAKLKDSLKDEHGLQAQLKTGNSNASNKQLERQLEEMKRFNEELKSALKEKKTKIPEAFICPITQDMMQEPVVASDGHTYERTAIELWLKNNNTSPMTGLQLSNKQLTPSHTLKSMIREFIDANKKK